MYISIAYGLDEFAIDVAVLQAFLNLSWTGPTVMYIVNC